MKIVDIVYFFIKIYLKYPDFFPLENLMTGGKVLKKYDV